MKIVKVIAVCLFALVIALPILLFNSEKDAVSEIDNRKLAPDPLTVEGDLTDNVERFVNDRIGLRDEMILGYTVLNDRLFGKMVHPSYVYGKDGYVFGAGITAWGDYTDYHRQFAQMVKQLQTYCEDREVPFLFVFEPAKPAVLQDYIAEGLAYDRSWVDIFFEELDALDVHYLDNTKTLRACVTQGKEVFNRKYDANHWNDMGAYYGVNAMLQEMQKDIPSVYVIPESDLTVRQKRMTSLPVSQFPIDELVPEITVNCTTQRLTSVYDAELIRDPAQHYFAFMRNQPRLDSGAPRALVFQGSYMNGFGYKFMAASLGEYYAVHDYHNVMDLDYYFNIFKPEYVVFEVAEYTFNETYFRTADMKALDLNPSYYDAKEDASGEVVRQLPANGISVERGRALTTLIWHTALPAQYAWLVADGVYDMRPVEGGFCVTVTTETYATWSDGLAIHALEEGMMVTYE